MCPHLLNDYGLSRKINGIGFENGYNGLKRPGDKADLVVAKVHGRCGYKVIYVHGTRSSMDTTNQRIFSRSTIFSRYL